MSTTETYLIVLVLRESSIAFSSFQRGVRGFAPLALALGIQPLIRVRLLLSEEAHVRFIVGCSSPVRILSNQRT